MAQKLVCLMATLKNPCIFGRRRLFHASDALKSVRLPDNIFQSFNFGWLTEVDNFGLVKPNKVDFLLSFAWIISCYFGGKRQKSTFSKY